MEEWADDVQAWCSLIRNLQNLWSNAK